MSNDSNYHHLSEKFQLIFLLVNLPGFVAKPKLYFLYLDISICKGVTICNLYNLVMLILGGPIHLYGILCLVFMRSRSMVPKSALSVAFWFGKV